MAQPSTAGASVGAVTEISVDGTGTDTIAGALREVARGIERRLHLGAQVYVSIDGKAVADLGIGEARMGVPMTPDSMVIWFSMTKPSVAVAVAQQWEHGRLELDDRVADHVPEFAANSKDTITLRHLLTHTAGIRDADAIGSTAAGDDAWDEIVAGICAVAPEPEWIPGRRAGYHLSGGMTMLAEVVRRVDGRRFERYVREEIYEPLGMSDCWVGMPAERAAAYGERLGTMHSTATGEAVPLDAFDSVEALARCIPGGGGRGPVRQLARLYEAMLARGELDGGRVLSPQAVEAMTTRHRVGLYDETFHADCDWGLGFAVDTFAMGRHASRRSFGHGGALSAISFADPECGLVAVVQTNGMCGNDEHYHRLADIATALYVDLGLAAPDDPGRAKAFPSVEFAVSSGPSDS